MFVLVALSQWKNQVNIDIPEDQLHIFQKALNEYQLAKCIFIYYIFNYLFIIVIQLIQFHRDKSIPSLDSLVFDDEEHSILSDLIEKQKEMESSCSDPPPKAPEMLPPQSCTDFNTARLFLSHFGFLSRLDDTSVSILKLVILDKKK